MLRSPQQRSCGQAANAFGTFDTERVIFTPDDTSVGRYDNGDGHASKSYWDEKTQRRIMWSWISGSFPCTNPEGFECTTPPIPEPQRAQIQSSR